MMKQLQLFLTNEDESRLSAALREASPGIFFINDNVWPETPDVRAGIEDCPSGRVYLYAGDLNSLPTFRRKFGDVEGPNAGCVIQILRGRFVDDVLLSGSVAVGFEDDDEEMRSFVNTVWKIVRKAGTKGVIRTDGRIDNHYLVGHDARAQIAEGRLRIADRAIRMPYFPAVT